MPRRNSPNEIRDLSDLSRLGELVYDKRLGQRASAKKNRRNRHYEKQFIRNTLAHMGSGEIGAVELGDAEAGGVESGGVESGGVESGDAAGHAGSTDGLT